jgi:hypothetical protein
MASVTYEARRALAPSHAAGSDYTIALKIAELQRPQSEDLKVLTQSLSGYVETLFFGEMRKWGVTLAPVQIRDAAIYYEFLRSTADGQIFTFDPYGSEGSGVLPLQVVRADPGYTESTFQREGLGGLTDWVSLGFQVSEVP